tara:strand:- start:10932 stop:12065 length:1134 start_codon:yes stop_codon:yes gene_type:complete
MAPLSNGMFLASLSNIGQWFHTTSSSLVLTIFMLGLAVSQLFYGPLLDRFGRKPVLMVGLVIYILSSVLAMRSSSFHMLLMARFFQGVGVCGTFVSVMAIARDSYHEDQLVKKMSMIMAMIGVCPLIAPLFGGYLQAHFGWQGSFVFLLILSLVYLLIVSFCFRESLAEKNHQALQLKHLFNNYKALVSIPAYQGYIITSACSYGILFAYGAAGAIIMMEHYHLSPVAYGWVFSINTIAILVMSVLAPRLVKRLGLTKLLMLGASLLLLGTLATLILNSIFTPTLILLLIPMWVATVGVACVRPTASSGAMSVSPKKIAGSSAAVFNFVSFVGGSISTYIVSLLHLTIVNFAVEGVVLACIAIIFSLRAHRATVDKK